MYIKISLERSKCSLHLDFLSIQLNPTTTTTIAFINLTECRNLRCRPEADSSRMKVIIFYV